MLLLAVLAALTAVQHRVWRSNLTLWSHAVQVSPSLARPAINLAVASRNAGDLVEAAYWLTVAGPRTAHDPRGAEYRHIIAREFAILELFGTYVCDRPSARPYC